MLMLFSPPYFHTPLSHFHSAVISLLQIISLGYRFSISHQPGWPSDAASTLSQPPRQTPRILQSPAPGQSAASRCRLSLHAILHEELEKGCQH